MIVRALVRGPDALSAPQVAQMESALPRAPGELRSELRVRYVHLTIMSSKGPVDSDEGPGADVSGARTPAERR